jgi:hypothetical protein
LIKGLSSPEGWVVYDNFLGNLGSEWCSILRKEAVNYYNSGYFDISQSSMYDPKSGGVIYYDKNNVFAMQLEGMYVFVCVCICVYVKLYKNNVAIDNMQLEGHIRSYAHTLTLSSSHAHLSYSHPYSEGGDSYYEGPRLHEYIVSLTKTLVPILSEAFPDAHLNATYASNKLAVCTGNGSAYDKHYDNSGSDDVRKLTVIYYMNQWHPALGGQFRIFGGEEGEDEATDVEPIADRLLVFWSDTLVHSVLPSGANTYTNTY